MQARVLRQLEQARLAIEVALVVVLQESGPRQLAVRQPSQAPQGTEWQAQRKATHDPVAHIELNECEQLGRCFVELTRRGVIPVPVEAQVGSENASAGYGRNVAYVR